MGELKRLGAIQGTVATPRMPAPAPRHCSICGREVKPLLLPTGRYIDRTCQCEREVKHRQQAEVERKERRQGMIERTYGWLGGSPDIRLASCTLDQLKPGKQPKREDSVRINFAIQQARIFIAKPKYTFLLYSKEAGLGKTHIMASICNALRERDMPSLFMTPPKFFTTFYDRMDKGNEWELVQAAIHTPFLVIDDITKATPKPFRQEVFFQIIDERTKAGRPMGVTANDMEELSLYIGDYAYSRLMYGCEPIMLTGKDCRSLRSVK